MNHEHYQVYVISYDSLYYEGKRVYLKTSPKRTGVSNIQEARRFGSLDTARKELAKIKMGNPRIERHSVSVDPTPYEVIE